MSYGIKIVHKKIKKYNEIKYLSENKFFPDQKIGFAESLCLIIKPITDAFLDTKLFISAFLKRIFVH